MKTIAGNLQVAITGASQDDTLWALGKLCVAKLTIDENTYRWVFSDGSHIDYKEDLPADGPFVMQGDTIAKF